MPTWEALLIIWVVCAVGYFMSRVAMDEYLDWTEIPWLFFSCIVWWPILLWREFKG